jgi:hypothetical protein
MSKDLQFANFKKSDKKIQDQQIVKDFAGKIARAMKDIASSHVYFIFQEAFGEMPYEEVTKILDNVIKLTPKVKQVKIERKHK